MLGTAEFLHLPLPLLLAAVSACVAVTAAVRTRGAGFGRALSTAIALILSYAGGAALVGQLPGLTAGANPLDLAAQAVLLGVFLLAWIWQAGRLPIPARLYIRMLNTGGPALIR